MEDGSTFNVFSFLSCTKNNTYISRDDIIFTRFILRIKLYQMNSHSIFIFIWCECINNKNIYILRNHPCLTITPGSEEFIGIYILNYTFVIFALVNNVHTITQFQILAWANGVIIVSNRLTSNVICIEVKTHSPSTFGTVPNDMILIFAVFISLSIINLIRIIGISGMSFRIVIC